MRSVIVLGAAALTLAGCTGGGLDRARPDEFAVARRAPLVVPPDFALAPPAPGAPRPQEADSSTQALEAMFGGPAPRSAPEQATLGNAGAARAMPGIRSEVGSPETNAVDKGAVTRDIIAAPEGDGQDARASTTAVTPAPAATPTPEPSPTPQS
ncbi:DUF3035 domain-containing protein [Sphingomonas sp.]|uniref:DUF3035 domain-containing protein n=1 Tax=Sphingomonas sp. TaxID=28214 RepID=UPI002DB68C90|nr:DUF3035 domain-containing protein [Sphingomonas sp.]HEU4968644.1 DUF3035 domain-containing protein [Sphingomonas sp.]